MTITFSTKIKLMLPHTTLVIFSTYMAHNKVKQEYIY